MADLNDIITHAISVDSNISINPLSKVEIGMLSNLVVWDKKTPSNKPMCFGGNYFKQADTDNSAILINTGSVEFDFELKAMMIAALHLGTVEGGTPYKWKSVDTRIRTLRRFCEFIQSKKYKSFRELNNIQELTLRNIIQDFICLPKLQGGMEHGKYTSAAKTVRDALVFLLVFGVVNKEPLLGLIDELTITKITKHEEEHRLKHSIIPTSIMKSIIATSTEYLEKAKSDIKSFVDIHTKANSKIEFSKAKYIRHLLITKNKNLLGDLSATRSRIKNLNLHVYTLVLAFTGMRDNEAYALKNHSHSQRVETGELVFTISSHLSKTTEGLVKLDWIANQIVYDAVDLLSRVNDIYKERARLILKYHRSIMSDNEINKFEQGIENNRLFGIQHTCNTARFIHAARGSDAEGSVSLSRHKVKVTAQDLEQLEKMGCNYQSVSQNSGKRGVKYKVGDFFNVTAHQFRHTFAWFIIANRLGDLDDIKYQFKHLKRVMTLVYSERGYESLSELRTVIEYFEKLVNEQAIEDIVESAKKEQIAGGGGDRLSKLLTKLNSNEDHVIFTTAQQPHFNNTQELIDFATKNSDSVRGLPHGYCTKGAGCKIKNASDPSHCLYCDTYFVTPRHLPYWKAIKHSCEQKIERIQSLPDTTRYQSFLTGLEDNLNAANEIIDKLVLTPNTNTKATVEN
jgi:hypothetical protein